MNQKHIDLANKFNSFAYELLSNEINCKNCSSSISDDILFRRIIFSRYYYALYHKCLAYDDQLSQSTIAGKHQAIIEKIKKKNDTKLIQTYLKLYNLRVWADYQLDNDIMATNIKLNTINTEVWNILKRVTI